MQLRLVKILIPTWSFCVFYSVQYEKSPKICISFLKDSEPRPPSCNLKSVVFTQIKADYSG